MNRSRSTSPTEHVHVPGMHPPMPAKITVSTNVARLTERLQPDSGFGKTHALPEIPKRDRYDLDDRLLHLTACLVPTPYPGNPLMRKRDRTPLEAALDEMFLGLSRGTSTISDDESTVVFYAETMGGEVPMWAAERAVRRATAGDLGRYFPGTGALLQLARSYLVPVRAEQEAIERILDARVIRRSDAERAREKLNENEAVLRLVAQVRAFIDAPVSA